jgi:hypothetical protein
MWYVISRNPNVTVVSDGGGEGAGQGDRAIVRQNMAGINSVGHHMFVLQRAGDDGMRLLNEAGLWVPLMEAYGFDPLSGDISTRRPEKERLDTIQRMLKEAMRAHRNQAGPAADSSSSSDDSENEERVSLNEDDDEVSCPIADCSVASPKPIYDPLGGPSVDPAVQAMPFVEFVLWDMASAYPDLHLPAKMSEVIEERVAAVEALVSIMRAEAMRLPLDSAKCRNISIAGYRSLQKGKFVADDAIDLVLGALTHVLGGRFVCKDGRYSEGPVSPLIRWNRPSNACYVIGTQDAARLVNCVKRAETYAASKRAQGKGDRKATRELASMLRIFQGRARHQTDEINLKKIVFEPGSKVFACTHLPGHYVSTEVANLGASTDVGEGGRSLRNAVTITRADSNSLTPQFSGSMHTALHVALRAVGAIGPTQEVEHLGLPLPPQDLPDCAFFMLTRLENWITGVSPPPEQWQVITRLLRCWTDFQAYRQLCHDGAIQDVISISLHKFRQGRGAIVPAAVTEAQALVPLAMPALQRQPDEHVLTEFWKRAIAALWDAEKDRHRSKRIELKRQLLDKVLKEASQLAEAAYEKEERAMPKQLCTTGPVLASASAPLGAQDKWSETYADLVQSANRRTSMDNNPCRYFLMAERDKRGATGEAAQGGPSEPSGEQDETSGAGQHGASRAKGGQSWQRRAIANAFLIWCQRHRGQLAVEDVFKRTDRFANRSERAVNGVRCPTFWPRAREHVHAYLGLPPPKGRDSVRPGPIHEAVQGAMKAQAETWGPPRGKMAVKFRIKSSKPVIETEATPRSYHDRVMEVISNTGVLPKPLACAKTRWGTRAKSFRWLSIFSRLMAAAHVHAHGRGREAAIADTAKDVFNEHGWVDQRNIQTPKPIGKQLHLLLNQTDILMLEIGGFVEQIMVGPMMNAMSHNLESSSTSVCGINSFFRKLLCLVKEHMFVGKFNLFDSFTGSDAAADFAQKNGQLLRFKAYSYVGSRGGKMHLLEKRRKGLLEGVAPPSPATVRLAHRGVETLRGAHMRNAFLINPLADVRGVMGRFCTDSIAGCVTTLLEGLRRASMMHTNKLGKWSEIVLYPTLEQQWQQEMHPHFKSAMGPEVDAVPVDAAGLKVWERTQSQRFQRNMIKAQWAVAQIVRHDMVGSIVKWFDHELYCILGFLACSLETRTVKARKKDDPNHKIMDVLVADKFAVANLTVAFRMIDELKSHWPDECLPDYVPSQLSKLMSSGQAMLQAAEFSLGKDIEGFILVDKNGRDLLDKDGNPMPVGPAPLERFEDLAEVVHDMALLMRSNNDSERVFTHASRGFTRGGRNVTPATISTWVRRKDWISAGLWGMEKNASFLAKFGKWRRFVSKYHQHMPRLFLPDIAGAEEKKMASQLSKLPLKYRRGESFAVSHIGPSKDFFTFGQKPPGKDDAEDAPIRTGILKRTSAGEKLRQKARAARARNKNDIPISKKPISKKSGQKPKKAIKAGTARKAKKPSVAAVAADSRSDVEDTGLGGWDLLDNGENEFTNEDSDRKLDGRNTSADLDTASPASASSLPVGASGEAAGAGPPISLRSPSQKEHKSFVQVREWIKSRAVKAARMEIRDKAKATKDAATVTCTSGASRLRSVVATAAKEDEIANSLDSDEDEYDAEWTPSSVTYANKDYITVTRSVGGESYRVNRGRMSSLTLHHVYDHQTGESQLVQIQSVWWDVKQRVWKMKYCRVYSAQQAIMAAELEDDKRVVLNEGKLDEKVVIQRGRSYLRDVCKGTDRLHHIGDVHITSQPVYIIGVAGWLPATALICDSTQLEKRKDELRTELAKHCGLNAHEAQRLAADPIYVGEHFSEARAEDPQDSEEASDASDTASDSEEQSVGRADALVRRPSRAPLRRLLEKVASGKPVNFFDGLSDVDDDDRPLFVKTSPRSTSICKEPDSDSDENAELDKPLKRWRRSGAVAGSEVQASGDVGAVEVAVGRGRGRGRGISGDGGKVPAQAGRGSGVKERRGWGRGRGKGRGGGSGGEVPAQAGDGSGVEERHRVVLPGRGRARQTRKSAMPR